MNVHLKKDEPNNGIAVSLQTLINMRVYAPEIDLCHRKPTHYFQNGNYLSRVRGRGMDFAEVREYQPGDDMRIMDWRVTARTGHPHSKIYEEERERPIFFIIDYSASMFFGTRNTYKSVLAAKTAAILAWSATLQNNKIGAIIFSGEEHLELPARGSEQGVLPLLKAFADTPAPFHYTQQSGDLARALKKLRHLARTGSLIIILSDFYTLNDQSTPQISALSVQHDVIAGFIYDPLEANPPPANYYAATNGENTITFNTRSEPLCDAYRQYFLERKDKLKKICDQYKISLLSLGTHQPILDNLLKPLRFKTHRL
jgi:uncharacterized protein (DUF58 family)